MSVMPLQLMSLLSFSGMFDRGINERIEIMRLIGFVMLYDHYKHMLAAQPAYLKVYVEYAKNIPVSN